MGNRREYDIIPNTLCSHERRRDLWQVLWKDLWRPKVKVRTHIIVHFEARLTHREDRSDVGVEI